MYCGNVFGHAMLENDFLVLDLDDCYDNNKTLYMIAMIIIKHLLPLSHVMILFLILLNGMLNLDILAKIE